jgi:hypothetical protein
LSNLKANSEEGDIVFDTTRQNTTGHRTMAKKKGGHYRCSFRETSADPDSLLSSLKTGHNDFDKRNSFIVPKTIICLPKLKFYPKNKDRVL